MSRKQNCSSKRSRCSRWSGDDPDEDLSPGPSMWTGPNRGKKEAMCLTWRWSHWAAAGRNTKFVFLQTVTDVSVFHSPPVCFSRVFLRRTAVYLRNKHWQHEGNKTAQEHHEEPVLQQSGSDYTHTAACWHLLDTPIITESRLWNNQFIMRSGFTRESVQRSHRCPGCSFGSWTSWNHAAVCFPGTEAVRSYQHFSGTQWNGNATSPPTNHSFITV